ncbi:MAG: NfeD family protein [Planctomycetota bacterium]|jgi:membrane-bound serine protease (ClpP class)
MILTLAQDAAGGNDAFLIGGFVLVAVALALLFLEFLIPSGGLIGLLCGVAAIASVVAFFRYDTTWGIIATLGYLVLGPVALVFFFKLWINSPLAGRMILGGRAQVETEIDDDRGASDQARRERLAQLQALIGVEGVTETALRPVGVVKIDGQRIDALAESGVILAGTTVVVTDVYDNQIKVRPV